MFGSKKVSLRDFCSLVCTCSALRQLLASSSLLPLSIYCARLEIDVGSFSDLPLPYDECIKVALARLRQKDENDALSNDYVDSRLKRLHEFEKTECELSTLTPKLEDEILSEFEKVRALIRARKYLAFHRTIISSHLADSPRTLMAFDCLFSQTMYTQLYIVLETIQHRTLLTGRRLS